MDITEAFRGEDISKTDFFDFVVAPDVGETQPAVNINRTLKSLGIFFENNQSNQSNNMNTFQEGKETNNNHLVSSVPNTPTSSDNSTGLCGSYPEHSFWSGPTCDKETSQLDTTLFEDLNKYCWSHDADNNSKISHPSNTDGAIYTLTVLNGDHGNTWYRLPESGQIKEEEEPPPNSQHQPMSSHNNPHHHSSAALDLDSILSIIPNQSNGHQFHPNGYHPHHPTSPHTMINHDVKIKVESEFPFNSPFPGNKDCSNNNQLNHIMDANDTSFNNNNNDWKLNNNNNNTSTAESLLRSALQGKSFPTRYNGIPKSGSVKVMDGHSELRRVLNTPPGTKTPLETSPGFLGSHEDDDHKLSMEGNTVVLFDDGGGGRVVGMVESENQSSANSMDDLILSHLDTSYPEDYEKLKRIANEVAESVNQYCALDQNGAYLSPHLVPGDLGHSQLMNHHAGLSPLLQQSNPPNGGAKPKKYSKKQTTGNKTSANGHQLPNNGIRKERSLHYCTICSKGFKDKYSVNVHVRTHTGEKPFACTLCGKSFRQKAHLAKHYQTHMAQKNGSSGNTVSKNANNKARFGTAKPS